MIEEPVLGERGRREEEGRQDERRKKRKGK
jgi:hypothetical protein